MRLVNLQAIIPFVLHSLRINEHNLPFVCWNYLSKSLNVTIIILFKTNKEGTQADQNLDLVSQSQGRKQCHAVMFQVKYINSTHLLDLKIWNRFFRYSSDQQNHHAT